MSAIGKYYRDLGARRGGCSLPSSGLIGSIPYRKTARYRTVSFELRLKYKHLAIV